MSETGQASSSAAVEMPKTGLAFSGGGIRSAALCSGVLRRLLQRGVEPDYLSCVSGGGYTGTAYLDWKHRHGRKDDPTWHKQFFEHMRSRAGLLCNWQKPFQGIGDTIVLVLLFLVVIIVSIVGCASFACPFALFIDLVLGKYLNAERFQCNETIKQECDLPFGSLAYYRMIIFLVTLAAFIICHIVSIKCPTKWEVWSLLFHLLSKFSGFLFAFTFFPWFIHDYLNYTPTWVEVGVVIVSAVTWFFLPVLRRYSSLVIIVYLFSYVIYWRVYDAKLLGVQHTNTLFLQLLVSSGVVLMFASILGEFHLRIVHIYNR